MSTKIQILGAGCDKCNRLYETAVEAIRSTGVDAKVAKVSEMSEIIALGVMTTPVMIIDGQIIITGRVPSLNEMKKLITDACRRETDSVE